ncbi:MAG TPA: hypothetical protein VHX49_10520, partial [Candidatus Acidoferrales bacterium]|nr:hypothetical protein [Candidatus Acidoferrales bacterium]
MSEETEKRKLARERLRRLRAARAKRLKDERAIAKKNAAAAKPAMTHEAKASLASQAKDKQKMRQLEINALERDVAALSGLTDPTDAGAAEIERIRHEVDELKRD